MTAFNVQQAVCTGRGFDAAGLGGKLRTFMVAAPLPGPTGGGGPGWYEHDASQVAAGTDPYVVFCDKNAPGTGVPAKYVQFLIPTATAGQVRVYFYLYWDAVNHVGLGMYGAHTLPTLDAADFIYDFRGGPEFLMLQTFTVSTWDGCFIDEMELDSNLIDSVSATTAVTNFTSADLQFRGLDLTGGSWANALDASGNFYASIVFVNPTYRVDIYKAPAKGAGDLVWRSNTYSPLAAAANVQTISGAAQNGSGVTFNVYMQGPSAADTTIVFRANQITVGVGEGAQFTVGRYYFIYDFTQRLAVNSFLVVSKATDVLTIDRLYRPFPLGAKIGSYPHPYCVGGSSTTLWNNRTGIPYFNVLGTAGNFLNNGGKVEISRFDYLTVGTSWSGSPSTDPSVSPSTDDNYISRMSPDRRNRWAVQRPGVVEVRPPGESSSASVYSGKTAYGKLKNVIAGSSSGMSPNIHGRRLNGIDYTYFRLLNTYMAGANGNWAAMFRETQTDT
jgi:hypothetical protein